MQENSKVTRIIVIGILLAAIAGAGYYFYSWWPKPAETPPPPAPAAADDGIDNFSQTGHLARNNPGMRPDVWYLVYEESGAVASRVELTFTAKSRCIIGLHDGPCEDSLIVIGSRAEIAGFRTGGQVFVHTYKQIDLNEKG